MNMELWSLEDVMRELQVGRPTAYRILKTYGRKLGRRYVVPADIVKTALWSEKAAQDGTEDKARDSKTSEGRS